MACPPPHRLIPLLAAALLLTPLASRAQVAPGSSGATTSSSTVESLSTTTTNTLTFSRDQTFVLSGSNININGTITVPGPPLGGINAVEVLPASAARQQSSQQIRVSASDAGQIHSVVLNPSLNATVREPDLDFDLAITQAAPGLTQSQRTDTDNRTNQTTTSLSVFTAPFVP
ncbi:hypothetical protein NZK33_02000 [Cyanobium sp. FGCU-6]|jgi:hypothetical protein|nr:hypothetical protein [Cyanobium sp. FGCU6]